MCVERLWREHVARGKGIDCRRSSWRVRGAAGAGDGLRRSQSAPSQSPHSKLNGVDKLQALVYDILPLEEGAGKRCSECAEWSELKKRIIHNFTEVVRLSLKLSGVSFNSKRIIHSFRLLSLKLNGMSFKSRRIIHNFRLLNLKLLYPLHQSLSTEQLFVYVSSAKVCWWSL